MGMLTMKQKNHMLKSGFLPSEIMAIDRAKMPDGKQQESIYNSEPFKAMIKSRREYITDRMKEGFTRLHVKDKIKEYYRLKSGRSPFDFLKLEYKPTKRLTDFVEAVKKKVRYKTSTLNEQKRKIRRNVRNVMPRYAIKRRVIRRV